MSVARSMRYDAIHSHLGHLAITATAKGKTETANYMVLRDSEDQFEVQHFAGEIKEGEPGEYRVCIRAGSESCGCKGFTYCRAAIKTCRHLASLKKLRDLNRI